MFQRIHRIILLAALGLVGATAAQATERGQLRALLGMPGQDLTTPLLPGWYGQINMQHYEAERVVGNGGRVETRPLPGVPGAAVRQGARVQASVVAARMTWLSELRVGEEGRFGLSATLPWVQAKVTAHPGVEGHVPPSLAGPVGAALAAGAAAASGEQAAQGDVEIAPFVDWQDDVGRLTAAFAVVAPTGDYDAARPVNPGAGRFWTFRPVLALAHVTDSGWELGVRNTYSFNTRNESTRYRSGQYWHADFSALNAVSDRLRLGVGGYLLIQTTRDDGPAVPAHGNKARAFALGPALAWQSESGRLAWELKVLEEFGVRNRPDGRVVWAHLLMRFD